MLKYNLRKVVYFFVYDLKWGDLYYLVHGLLNDGTCVGVYFLDCQGVSTIRHMLNELYGGLARLDVNIVIDAIDHLRHLARESHSGCFHYQLGTIDIKRFVLPGTLPAIECLLHRAKKGPIRGLDGILSRFIHVENRTPRL